MDIKKIIKRIEAMKVELAGIHEEAVAEGKRVIALQNKAYKARTKLRAKLSSLPSDDAGVARAAELQKQMDANLDYFGLHVGDRYDYYPEDSILGAISAVQEGLDALVKTKGKKVVGHLVEYEEELVAIERLSDK